MADFNPAAMLVFIRTKVLLGSWCWEPAPIRETDDEMQITDGHAVIVQADSHTLTPPPPPPLTEVFPER